MKKVLDNKCPSCSATIHFKPELGKFKCDYCHSEFTAEQLQDMNELNKEELDTNYVNYNCPDCGAEIITDANTAATFCVYCGNTSIIRNRLSGEFAPSKIIPFKIEKEKVIKAFKGVLVGRPLAPKFFNKEENIEKIQGVYIPFWLYKIDVKGGIEASATKVTSWTRGNNHYTKTDYYKVVRKGVMTYDRVPVDGSVRFDNSMMNSIEPFDYSKLIDYNHAYLSGFLAEKYDVDSIKAFSDASSRTLNSTKEEMLNSMVGYTSKNITKNELTSDEKNAEYVLLPVWMVNVKFNNKYYLFAMNGQSGKFIGDIPIDKKKTILMSILIFVGLFIYFIIISYIFYLIGGNS